MGGAASTGVDNDELIDNIKSAGFIKTSEVERVFRAVDRAFYFLPNCEESAYQDVAWKKGNLHLSAPCIYGEVLENLKLQSGLSFLNLGSGTGYVSTMAGLILGPYGINHGIELHDDVVNYAHMKLQQFKEVSPALDGYEFCEPKFIVGNCLCLSSINRLYDRIYCGAACPENHENYMKNLLKVGGILVMPFNEKLATVTRTSETHWDIKYGTYVSFSTLKLPSAEDMKTSVILPDVHPLQLQEVCRSVIRSHLRTLCEAEFPDVSLTKKVHHRKVSTSSFRHIIIPPIDSSEDEEDREWIRGAWATCQFFENLGIDYLHNQRLPVIGFSTSFSSRRRDSDEGEDEGAHCDEERSAQVHSQSTGEESEVDADIEGVKVRPMSARGHVEVRISKLAKREKLDSGICPDIEPLPDLDGEDSDMAEMTPYSDVEESDRTADEDEDMEIDDSDEEPHSSEPLNSSGKPKHSKNDEETHGPLYGKVMRLKITSLPLPPALKSYLNYHREF